jgi:hypothetical protein
VTAVGVTPVRAKVIQFYDREKGGEIDPSISVSDERSSLAKLNQYEPRENHEVDYSGFTPGAVVNPEVGFALGGIYTHVVPGWKVEPFSARHTGAAYFATETLGVMLDYAGLFPQSRGIVDQQVDKSRLASSGFDQIAFHVQTNPGTAAGPLLKVASGGELSRFLLALKVVLADRGSAPVLIFDEFDTGVGGAVADAIGRSLARLAGKVQVLAVTHAPQVAARAQRHLLIEKQADGRVRSRQLMPVRFVPLTRATD